MKRSPVFYGNENLFEELGHHIAGTAVIANLGPLIPGGEHGDGGAGKGRRGYDR